MCRLLSQSSRQNCRGLVPCRGNAGAPGVPPACPALHSAAGLAGLQGLLLRVQSSWPKEWNCAWVLHRITMVHEYADVLVAFMHKTLLYIHVYVIGILSKCFVFFFFLWNLLWIDRVHQGKKDGRERKLERGRDALSTKHVRLIILTFRVSVFHSRLQFNFLIFFWSKIC